MPLDGRKHSKQLHVQHDARSLQQVYEHVYSAEHQHQSFFLGPPWDLEAQTHCPIPQLSGVTAATWEVMLLQICPSMIPVQIWSALIIFISDRFPYWMRPFSVSIDGKTKSFLLLLLIRLNFCSKRSQTCVTLEMNWQVQLTEVRNCYTNNELVIKYFDWNCFKTNSLPLCQSCNYSQLNISINIQHIVVTIKHI